MKIPLILVFGLLLAGCLTTGPKFAEAPFPEPARTAVYVYRLAGGSGAWVPFSVYLDREKVASLYEDSFTWFYVPEGRHQVTVLPPNFTTAAQPWVKPLLAKLFARPVPETVSTYYFRYWDESSTGASGTEVKTKFERVQATEARKEMATLRYSQAKLELERQ